MAWVIIKEGNKLQPWSEVDIPKSVNLLFGVWRNSAYSCPPSVLWSCNTNGLRVTIPYKSKNNKIGSKHSSLSNQKKKKKSLILKWNVASSSSGISFSNKNKKQNRDKIAYQSSLSDYAMYYCVAFLGE